MTAGDRPVGDEIEQHLAWARQRGLRPTTLYYRRNVLRSVELVVGQPLVDATREDLEAWFASLTSSADTRSVMLSHLRMFFAWAERFELITTDPTKRLDAPIRRRRVPRPIDEEALARVLATADDRIRPWLYLAAFAGLRAFEVARLRAEDVLADADPPVLVVADGKGGRQRIVPLHPELARVLGGSALPGRGYLFVRVRESGPKRTSGLCDSEHVPAWLVSQLANRHLRAQNAGATFHALRHLFATKLYANSKDLRVTQEMLGHASPATTAAYTAWSHDRAVAAVCSLDIRQHQRGEGGAAV